MEGGQRWIWWLWSSGFGNAHWGLWFSDIGGELGGGHSGGSKIDGRHYVTQEYIPWLTQNCGNVESRVQYSAQIYDKWEMRCRWRAGNSWSWVDDVSGVNSWSWYVEFKRDDLTLHSLVIVGLWMRNRELWGEWWNNHERLRLMRIWCTSEWTMPDMVGMIFNPVGKNTDL